MGLPVPIGTVLIASRSKAEIALICASSEGRYSRSTIGARLLGFLLFFWASISSEGVPSISPAVRISRALATP